MTPGDDAALDLAEDLGDVDAGDAACWAHLVCPECGAVVGPDPHRAGCPLAESPPPA